MRSRGTSTPDPTAPPLSPLAARVLNALRGGSRRLCDVKNLVPGADDRALTICLVDLEAQGHVVKRHAWWALAGAPWCDGLPAKTPGTRGTGASTASPVTAPLLGRGRPHKVTITLMAEDDFEVAEIAYDDNLNILLSAADITVVDERGGRNGGQDS